MPYIERYFTRDQYIKYMLTQPNLLWSFENLVNSHFKILTLSRSGFFSSELEDLFPGLPSKLKTRKELKMDISGVYMHQGCIFFIKNIILKKGGGAKISYWGNIHPCMLYSCLSWIWKKGEWFLVFFFIFRILGPDHKLKEKTLISDSLSD